MEWLWLLLLVAGLGLLWLAIKGVERLTQNLKTRETKMRQETKALKAKIDAEERNFVRAQAARDFIENAPIDAGATTDAVPAELNDAVSLLSADELLDSMVKRAFGNSQGAESITATQSAFDREPVTVAVAQGEGVLPIKAKPSTKTALSKEEQKMLKKIKRGG